MSIYSYYAVDSRGKGAKRTLQAADQAEALQRIKEMGFFPTKIAEQRAVLPPVARARLHAARLSLRSRAATAPVTKPARRVKMRRLAVFTRQLATLLQAGMPLLRGLRLLQEQEADPRFRDIIAGLAANIEGGGSFSEALAQYPKVFDRLYLNMVKAGEVSGALEVCLQRLAQFMEKAGRIKSRVRSAMFYPAMVITVASAVMALMLLFIVPRFKLVFADLNNGAPLPAFTQFVIGVSESLQHHFLGILIACVALYIAIHVALRTRTGRRTFDQLKLKLPVLGPVMCKVAIARFSRTLGTLVTSGVPILPALNIVREASGNIIVGELVDRVHDNVEQGESVVGPLRGSGIFPAMVVGMVEVGEQTGALPEMLNNIADTYDEEVDNSVAAMTSLLEPVLIVTLGIIIGTVVIAMALPIWGGDFGPGAQG